MLKRLIEVALPLKEVSEQSAREKSIRYGHISTLHLWWARKPLAACRAAVLASLIPDPDDTECPKSFRKEVIELLGHERFRPSGEVDGKPIEDTAQSMPRTPQASGKVGELAQPRVHRTSPDINRRSSQVSQSGSRECCAEGSGPFCGRRGDSSRSASARLRDPCYRPEPRSTPDRTLHAGISPEVRAA